MHIVYELILMNLYFTGLTDWADSKIQPKPTENSVPKCSEESLHQPNIEELLGEGEELFDLGEFSSVHSVQYQWHQNQENQQEEGIEIIFI